MGILYAIIRIKILTASLQHEKCQSGQNENAFHLSDWMQRRPLDSKFTDKIDTDRVRYYRGKNHIGRHTWKLNSFAFILSQTLMCREEKKLFYQPNESCFFFTFFSSQGFIVQIKKKYNAYPFRLLSLMLCVCMRVFLLLFFHLYDALHKDRYFFFLILHYVIFIAPIHTWTTEAHLKQTLHSRSQSERKIDSENK